MGEIPNEANDFSMDIYSEGAFHSKHVCKGLTNSSSNVLKNFFKFVETEPLENTTVFIVARAAK